MNRSRREHVRHCAERLTRAFTLLGKRWSGVILRVLLEGPAHFAVLARKIPGISERMLQTESGRAIGPALLKLGKWAERYMPPPARRKASRSRRAAIA